MSQLYVYLYGMEFSVVHYVLPDFLYSTREKAGINMKISSPYNLYLMASIFFQLIHALIQEEVQ